MSFTENDVREGDVMLMMYDEFSAKLIALLDNGIYSHSAYYTGSEVAGVIRKGLVHQDLKGFLADPLLEYLDVYRFYGDKDDPSTEMGSPDWPAAPVTQVCKNYIDKGVSYAVDELYFFWVLILMHDAPKTGEGRKMVWYVINAIVFLLDQLDPKLHKGMICSEFLTRLFMENDAFPKYALKFSDTYTVSGPPDEDFKDAYEAVLQALKKVDPELEKKIEEARKAGVSGLTPELVTPNNLRHSPSLKFMGRIKGSGSPEQA
ncbi:hypothetical protein AB2B41_13615 [Marimonas sp. MJW-29]|uniref:Uncharacterized protein n=1 Tax=Sulfitobacter sediminis TaxID=3234186 RepID=A0ABV3RQP4_9RHOB